MSHVPLRASWTQEEFFAWAEAQEERYEFDGVRPVAVPGATVGHSMIAQNLRYALDTRSSAGSPWRVLGPNSGVATVGFGVRYPDAVICFAEQNPAARTVAGAVAVFEVIDEDTAASDRLLKAREYAAVASILRYLMVETKFACVTVLERKGPEELWRASALALEDAIELPEVGIEVPVSELYRDLSFSGRGVLIGT